MPSSLLIDMLQHLRTGAGIHVEGIEWLRFLVCFSERLLQVRQVVGHLGGTCSVRKRTVLPTVSLSAFDLPDKLRGAI